MTHKNHPRVLRKTTVELFLNWLIGLPKINPGIVASDVNVREELARLGMFLPHFAYELIQQLITEITGKPYQGQKPLFKKTPIFHLFCGALFLVTGVTLSALYWQSAFWVLLISWPLTIGAARDLQVNIGHFSVHKQVFGNNGDRILAEMISTILFTQDFEGYFHDHMKRHHKAKYAFSFQHDPDGIFLWKLGFRPDQGGDANE